jgi:hypothetical protein
MYEVMSRLEAGRASVPPICHLGRGRVALGHLEIAIETYRDISCPDTDTRNGDRGDNRSVRNHSIAGLLAVVWLFGNTLISSPAQEDASVMKSVTVNCSAFKKEANGKWTTSRQSVLTGPGGSASGPVLSFPGLNLEMLRPYGVSMIDLLNRKCSR